MQTGVAQFQEDREKFIRTLRRAEGDVRAQAAR
jgi:hypothetical protein